MKEYSIGPIAGKALKLRYAAISTFLGGETFDPINGFDIFIDLNVLVSSLSTSAKFLNSLPFSDGDAVERDLISNVLSVVKHWKGFTSKYNDTRIFLMVNDFEMAGLPEQNIIKSYMMPYINKFEQERFAQFNYFWTEAMKRVEIILKYVPKSYLIRCNRVDNYIIPNIVDDYSKNCRFRLIISGAPIMTTYMLEPNTKVILSKFNHQLSDPTMICQSVSSISDEIMNTFVQNKVFYSLLNSVIGDFDRGIIGITQLGISSFANDLLRAVERGEIPSDPKSIESVLPIINTGYHDYIKKAYQLIDISSHTQLIPPSIIEKIKSNIIDLYDIDGLQSLSVDGMNLIELL